MPTNPDGPFLSVAALCEKVIEDRRGVFSLIGLIDHVMLFGGPGAPAEMPPSTVQTTAVIGFKSGNATGQRTLRLAWQTPSGQEQELGTAPLVFEGGERGTNLVANIAMGVKEQGLHWISVFLDGELISRIPLRVTYQRTGGS